MDVFEEVGERPEFDANACPPPSQSAARGATNTATLRMPCGKTKAGYASAYPAVKLDNECCLVFGFEHFCFFKDAKTLAFSCKRSSSKFPPTMWHFLPFPTGAPMTSFEFTVIPQYHRECQFFLRIVQLGLHSQRHLFFHVACPSQNQN